MIIETNINHSIRRISLLFGMIYAIYVLALLHLLRHGVPAITTNMVLSFVLLIYPPFAILLFFRKMRIGWILIASWSSFSIASLLASVIRSSPYGISMSYFLSVLIILVLFFVLILLNNRPLRYLFQISSSDQYTWICGTSFVSVLYYC